MFWVISAVDLPEGQKVSGPIAVDVPPGKTITEIVVTNQYAVHNSVDGPAPNNRHDASGV
jgi:hypothetical protein